RPRAPVLDELSMPIHRWNTVSRDELEDPSPTNEGQRVRQHDECVGPWACRRREQSVEVARAVDLKGYRPHFECSRCALCIPPLNRLARIAGIPHDSKVRYVRTRRSEQVQSLTTELCRQARNSRDVSTGAGEAGNQAPRR